MVNIRSGDVRSRADDSVKILLSDIKSKFGTRFKTIYYFYFLIFKVI
jgi:hypothetical protein